MSRRGRGIEFVLCQGYEAFLSGLGLCFVERLSLKMREIDERDGGDAKCQMGFRIRREREVSS